MYYSNCDASEQHLLFIGRFAPLHRGHTWIMKHQLEKQGKPLLILVRNTVKDPISAESRCAIIQAWFERESIRGAIGIIPDISGLYYGRGVGYAVEEIPPPHDIRTISATEIRSSIRKGEMNWKSMVPEGTAEIIERLFT